MTDLWWVMFWVSALLLALVVVLFAWSYVRPASLRRLTERQWILAGGVAMPLPVLLVLSGASLVVGEQLLARGEGPRIAVTASQWNWEFHYPGREEPLLNVLHMPAGVPVELLVTSRDVIHSFWIPRLGGKIDAVPGHQNRIRLIADRPGVFHGICAEYCGTGHDVMRFVAVAHSVEEFEAALGEAQ